MPYRVLLIAKFLLLLVFVSIPVSAGVPLGDGTGVNSQILWVAPGPSSHATISSSDVLPHFHVSAGALLGHHRKPLGLKVNETLYWSIRRVTSVEFAWALGILDRIQLGLVVPVVLEQSGDGATPIFPRNDPSAPRTPHNAAAGDIRFHAKVRAIGRHMTAPSETRGLGLALDLALSVPTGDAHSFAGEEGIVLAPGMILDYRHLPVSVSLNVGARLRSGEQASLANATIGNQMASGLAITTHFREDRFLVSAEANLLAELASPERVGLEWRIATGMRPGARRAVTIWLSGGSGVSHAALPLLGISQMRFLVGLTYAPSREEYETDAFWF